MEKSILLNILSQEYPNRRAAYGEIVRLKALMSLPKGTEYFFSDIHGEDRAFIHLMRSASGNIRRKIRDVYRSRLSEEDQNEIASLIYDPDSALSARRAELEDERWIRNMILRLVEVGRFISSKYPRAQIHKLTPDRYQDVVEEFFYTNDGEIDRRQYYFAMIDGIIAEGASIDFIKALAHMIQRICVNHLHIVGDLFDRGPGPEKILEELIRFENVDVQWGNHDVEWMGAALGNAPCMMSVMRNAIRYNTFDALEDGYGIHLRALNDFAVKVYGDDPCERFDLHVYDENVYNIIDRKRAAKMHKAIAILEFKLEGQLLERHPEYRMQDRIVLKKVDWKTMEYVEGDKRYPMLDTRFPTIDPGDPLRLSDEEKDLLKSIRASFMHSERLKRHMRFLYAKGSSYLAYNGNLLFHGCLPMKEDGSFDVLHIDGKDYSGKSLMDYLDYSVTQAFNGDVDSIERHKAIDFMWYLWCGPKSPMFGKSKMSTFENYFVDDSALRKEIYNPYFHLCNQEEICDAILMEFGLTDKHSHIINGHVPVKIKDGQTPMRANGKLFVIDGGIAKAYQEKTGIAGYTLIFNSHHIALAEHRDFSSITNSLETYSPLVSTVDRYGHRVLIGDTDLGKKYETKIKYLHALIESYTRGELKENFIIEK